MNESIGSSVRPRGPALRSFVEAALLVATGLATVGAPALVPKGAALALVPVSLVAVVWMAVRLPLVTTASALLFLLLGLEDTQDTFGQWRSPFAIVGDAFHARLDTVLGLPGAAVTGMEVVAVGLLLVWLSRKARSRSIDAADAGAASVVVPFLVLYVSGVALSEVVGLARGLGAVPWKLRNLLHPVLLTMLFLAAFRGPRDNRVVARVVVLAACARALLAIVVQREGVALTGGKYAYATSHGDSVLFAVAAFLLVMGVLERPSRRNLVAMILALPLVVTGAVENDRRLVWVMIAMMFAVAYVLAPMQGWKRGATKLALVAIPLAVVYVAVGWNSQSKLFAPVRTFRGVTDTSMDRSAYWREVEIWNIAVSIRESPILGTGLGGAYTEFMANDDVSEGFKEYREWPHNTVLGLLLLMGLLPFTAMWALLPLVIFLSVRSYRRANGPDERVAALGCIAAAVACLVLAYGDTGAHFAQFKIFLALAIAVSARLAVATGAWPTTASPVEG